MLPIYRSARTARQVLRKERHRRQLLTSLPWLVGLQYMAAAGEFVGYLTGLRSSPDQLR